MCGFYNDRPSLKVMDYKRIKLNPLYKEKVNKVVVKQIKKDKK